MSEELKPCPFCGGKAQVNQTYIVSCQACRTFGDDYLTEAAAIIAWNRRVGPQRWEAGSNPLDG
jgi:Lar family restriction alleviation protein